MRVLGIMDNELYILIEGARIIINVKLELEDLSCIKEYADLPTFNSFTEVEVCAYEFILN